MVETIEHAAVEKPKPGRKPLTSEPKNKRTAQNRAAQRAFRERKEKRLKELEDKVTALETEKKAMADESQLLRDQVQMLLQQLNNKHATPYSGGSVPSLDTTPSSIFTDLSETKNDAINDTLGLNLDLNVDVAKYNDPDLKGVYDESLFCKELNSACGTSSCPIPATKKEATSIPSVPSSEHSDNSSSMWNFKSPSTPASSNKATEMDFLFNNENPTIDTAALVQNNPEAFATNFDFEVDNLDFDNDDLFDSLIKPEEPLDALSDLQSTINTNAEEPEPAASDSEIVPSTDANLMKCTQVWERLTTFPRFSDLDIENLCDELKQKAKCSESGVVIDGKDVGQLLQKAVSERQKQQMVKTESLGGLDATVMSTFW